MMKISDLILIGEVQDLAEAWRLINKIRSEEKPVQQIPMRMRQAEAWEIVQRISSTSSRDIRISEGCFYDASAISQGSHRFKEEKREMRTLVEVAYRIATKGRETRKRIATDRLRALSDPRVVY